MINQQDTAQTTDDHRVLVGVTFAAALLLFWNLGALTQFSRAEVYFAEVAREMLITGDWITPRFCEEIFFDKPPLTYWLIAVCFRLFGLSEAVARIPSALAGTATVAFTLLFTRRHYGQRAGLISGLALTTSLAFWTFARYAMSDALLTLFVAGALFAYWEGLGPNPQWKTLITLGHISLALATITKGPIGPLLAVLALAAAAIFVRELEWKRLLHPGSLLAYLIVAAPWYVAAYLKHGDSFLDYFFVGENLSRFLGDTYLKDRLPIYYLGVLLTLFFPWSIWLPLSLASLLKRQTEAFERSTTSFLICWTVSTIGFFSISRFKLDYYILPCNPALAILVGVGLSRLSEQTKSYAWIRKLLTVLTATIFVGLGILFWKYTSTIALASSAVSGAGLLLWMLKSNYQRALPFVMAGTVATIFVLLPAAGPGSNASAQTIHRFAKQIVSRKQTEAFRAGAGFELAVWYPDLRFYTGLSVRPLEHVTQIHDFLKTPGPALLLLPEEKLNGLSITRNFRILDKGPYLGHGLWNKNLRRKKQQTIVLMQID